MPLPEPGLPPLCEMCGTETVRIGKLPRVGLRPLVHVYKCNACNQIASVEFGSGQTAPCQPPAASLPDRQPGGRA